MPADDMALTTHPAGRDIALYPVFEELKLGRYRVVKEVLAQTGHNWQLRTFRSQVITLYAASTRAIDYWHQEEPSNPDALMMWARVLTQRMFHLRLPSNDRAVINAANHARRACHAAIRACPQDPVPRVDLLSLAQFDADPRYKQNAEHWAPSQTSDALPEGPWPLFWAVRQRDPENREAYQRMLQFFYARGAGAHVFAQWTAMRAGECSILLMLPLYAYAEDYRQRRNSQQTSDFTYWTDHQVRHYVRLARDSWFHYLDADTCSSPALSIDLNLLAYALTVSGPEPRARQPLNRPSRRACTEVRFRTSASPARVRLKRGASGMGTLSHVAHRAVPCGVVRSTGMSMSYHYTSKKERSAQIDRILRARIADGTWPPGYVFNWPQLVEEFSLHSWDVPVVLSPVLRKIRLDGLIESRPYIGVRVVAEGEHWSPPAAYAELPHDEYIEIVLRERLHDALNGKGIHRPGEQFSPLADLAEEFGVSTATVRKATTPLKRQNILVLIGTNRTHVASDLAKFSAEEILTPSARRRPGRMKLEAFGESHTLAEWAQHPRCRVDRQVLHTRYVSGWDLEKALVTPKSFSRVHPPKPWASGEATTQDAYTIARQMLLSRISDGTYPLGAVIPSADISIRLGIPEESVLEALRDLRDIRMVDHRAGIGYFTAITSEALRATDVSRSS